MKAEPETQKSVYEWHRWTSLRIDYWKSNNEKSDSSKADTSIAKFDAAQVNLRLQTLMSDPSLFMEIRDLLIRNKFPITKGTHLTIDELKNSLDELWSLEPSKLFEVEAVLMAFGRPSLLIQDDTFTTPLSEVLKTRLLLHRNKIVRSIRSVGRIQYQSSANKGYSMGAAWVLDASLVVTSRSVAKHIQDIWEGSSPWSSSDADRRVEIELKGEWDRSPKVTTKVTDVVYESENTEGDFAILKIQSDPSFSYLSKETPESSTLIEGTNLALIGYPCLLDDSSVQPQYFPKRLSIGRLTTCYRNRFSHDCLSSGTSSGSLVIDIDTGKIAGIHSGVQGSGSFATRADVIFAKLHRLRG